MEVLKNTQCLEFNSNTLEEVREEFNLNQDGIVKMLDNFEKWIAKQQHFTKKVFSRTYLETGLIHAKGSIERAKSNLDKLCTLKTLLPIFFEKHDIKNEFKDISGFILHGTVPKLLKSNYRIYVVKLVSSDFDPDMLMEYNRIAILEGYGLRVNAIYVISPSKTIDVFVTLLKQVLSDKIAGRINVVKTLEALHEHVPKELLPKDYGGEEKSLKEINENWTNVLSTKENVEYFKEMSRARTDEKYRLPDKYNDQVLGMPGSFRTLSVD